MATHKNIGGGERVISGAISAALLGIGQQKRNPVLGVLGLELARRAVTGRSFFYNALDVDTRRPKSFAVSFQNGRYHTRRSVTIYRPRDALFELWCDPSKMKIFMFHLKEIQELGEKRSRWVYEVPGGASIEWISEITEFVPNERFSWRTIPGSQVDLSGSMRFVDAPGNQGTEIHGELEFRVPGGALARTLAQIFGRDPDQQLRANLRRFKKLAETGEIITVEGQPSGRAAA